jgi:hypothetical protein
VGETFAQSSWGPERMKNRPEGMELVLENSQTRELMRYLAVVTNYLNAHVWELIFDVDDGFHNFVPQRRSEIGLLRLSFVLWKVSGGMIRNCV